MSTKLRKAAFEQNGDEIVKEKVVWNVSYIKII
jgi:hypothetical protein